MTEQEIYKTVNNSVYHTAVSSIRNSALKPLIAAIDNNIFISYAKWKLAWDLVFDTVWACTMSSIKGSVRQDLEKRGPGQNSP
jgi:hypothetical protein